MSLLAIRPTGEGFSEDIEVSESELVADLESLFNRLELIGDNMSTEGLSNITQRIVASLTDLVSKVTLNISSNVLGMFKEVKRSELESYMASKKGSIRILKRASYSDIYRGETQSYPFTKSPNTVATFFTDTFKTFDMIKRINALTKDYNRFAIMVKQSNVKDANTVLDNIDNLNMVDTVSGAVNEAKEMVVVKLSKKLGRIGDNFDSVEEIVGTVGSTLKCSDELNIAAKTANATANLNKALDSVYKAISGIKADIDITKLKRCVASIRGTGELLTSYGMLVKEYHHLEHFMVNTVDTALVKAKKKA